MSAHKTDPGIARSEPPAGTERLIVASNRLPISLQLDEEGYVAKPSSGGLASAMAGVKKDMEGFHWVGWPGCVVPEHLQENVRRDFESQNLSPVFLTEREEESYYRDQCNQVFWPLFHYFQDRVSYESGSWACYEEVNRRFAEEILEVVEPGDKVWIHDFHLMLVPGLLRAAMPELEIGFFLHIPWPSSEIFRLLPNREQLLRGLLGADYIAFHTNDYALHFRATCLRVLGLDSDPDGIAFENRRIGIGRHPIGIDTEHFREIAEHAETFEMLQELRRRYQGRKVILGVERLDYSKGIPLKLQAFERYLQKDPERAQQVTLLQVIVPSRLDSEDYQDLKDEIEGEIGRINGKYGGPGYTPVEYMHRSVSPEQLVAMYQFADVGMVTPIRDGMNLVAQEFVLCQENGRGILLLSEFAGAAQVLGGSVLVNPWDVDNTAKALESCLDMTAKERQRRMTSMVPRVDKMDCKIWAREFMAALERVASHSRAMHHAKKLGSDERSRLRTSFAEAKKRCVALDYDGTLRELQPTPEMAAPTEEILNLLENLSALPDTQLHLVSGRSQVDLETWFGHLPIHLSCEHGSRYRKPGKEWKSTGVYDLEWMEKVHQLLEQVSHEVPGTRVETKQFSLAWHYRMADLDYGLWRARELLATLEQEVANLPVEVISGNKVIEVRAAGVSKGNYLRRVLARDEGFDLFLCIGDDRTDQDMYRALPDDAYTLHVGESVDEARFTVPSPQNVRELLASLCTSSAGAAASGDGAKPIPPAFANWQRGK